ncbi:MAG: helix-turn-helix transcriptional regulator [Patescibacteria group bacterium]|mgnify:FL=1
MKKKYNTKGMSFEEHLKEELKDPKFKKYFNEYGKQLEIAYAIFQLRKREGISQAELAKKIGTKQSDVARMEAGEQNFTTEMLQKIATALNRNLKITFTK